jgi:hypothetical protein
MLCQLALSGVAKGQTYLATCALSAWVWRRSSQQGESPMQGGQFLQREPIYSQPVFEL